LKRDLKTKQNKQASILQGGEIPPLGVRGQNF
jgi:hypothetical protein